MVIGTEVFWWLMESSDFKVVGIKKTETLMWPRDGNFICYAVMTTRSSWWKPDLCDENQIFLMETRSSWWKPDLREWQPDLCDGNQIFVMKTRSSWWKPDLCDGKFQFLGDESLIFSVMVIPNSDPVGYLFRYSRSDRVQIHIN